MSFTLLDFILFGIMGVSGLLALMRGFTREVLSLIAWGLAALAAYFASQRPEVTGFLLPYLDKPIYAQVGAGVLAFVLVLIIVSIISVRISDLVVDSSAGAIDRTLGFVYGLARGLVLVAIAYLLYGWLQPVERQEPWVKEATTFGLVQKASELLRSFMPPEIAETLSNSSIVGNPQGNVEATETPQAAPEAPVTQGDQQGLNNLSNDAAQPETPPQEGEATIGDAPATRPAAGQGTQQQ